MKKTKKMMSGGMAKKPKKMMGGGMPMGRGMGSGMDPSMGGGMGMNQMSMKGAPEVEIEMGYGKPVAMAKGGSMKARGSGCAIRGTGFKRNG